MFNTHSCARLVHLIYHCVLRKCIRKEFPESAENREICSFLDSRETIQVWSSQQWWIL